MRYASKGTGVHEEDGHDVAEESECLRMLVNRVKFSSLINSTSSMTGDGFVQVFCCVKADEASNSNNDLFLHTST